MEIRRGGAECSALSEVNVVTPQTAIGANAFADTPISALPVSDTTKAIGDYSFARCSALAEASLPKELQTIGSGAFAECPQLSAASVPVTVTSIGSYAFHIPALRQLYVYVTSPLPISEDTFANYDDCTLYVPEAALSDYAEAPVWKKFLYIRPLQLGDVNMDGSVSITDVMLTVNHILGNEPERFHEEYADVNSDGRINVADVMLIVRKVSGQ